MNCLICGSIVVGNICICGEKMIRPVYARTTIELKNNDIVDIGNPEYLRHMDEDKKLRHQAWITDSIKKTIHLTKKEKSSFWMSNLKLALNGELSC